MKNGEQSTINTDDKQRSIRSTLLTLLAILTVLVGLSYMFYPLYPQQLYYGVVFALGIITMVLYFWQLQALELTAQTPVADTLVLVGGISIIMSLLPQILETTIVFPFWRIGISLILTGFMGKLLLLDRLLGSFISTIDNKVQQVLAWVVSAPFNTLRSIFFLGGLLFYYLSLTTTVSLLPVSALFIPADRWLASLMVSSSFLLTFLFHSENPTSTPWRIVVALVGIGLVVLGGEYFLLDVIIIGLSATLWSVSREQFSSLLITMRSILKSLMSALQTLGGYIQRALFHLLDRVKDYPVGTVQLTLLLAAGVVSISNIYGDIFPALPLILAGVAVLPWLYRILRKFFPGIINSLKDFLGIIREYPVGSIQTVALLGSLPAYFLAPAGEVIEGISWDIFLPLVCIVIAATPTVYQVLKAILPGIYVFIRAQLSSLTSVGGIVGIAAVISIFFVPPQQPILRITLAIIGGLGLSVSGKFFLMRLYDRLILGIYKTVSGMRKVLRFFIPDLKMGRVISILAWLFLLLSLTGWFIPNANGTLLRWLVFLVSVILWNSAYEKRRLRIIRLINRFFGGILSTLKDVSLWFFNNIILLVLWIIAANFLVISVVLIFPGLSSTISNLFGEIIENRLVSSIIGVSLFGIGILTIQQAVARKNELSLGRDEK